jgi:hypothetical protein
VEKFLKYAENRRKYLHEMLRYYKRRGMQLDAQRIERDMDDLEERMGRALARGARAAREVC